MSAEKNVPAVASPHVGGRSGGAAPATACTECVNVIGVEAADEDPRVLRQAT